MPNGINKKKDDHNSFVPSPISPSLGSFPVHHFTAPNTTYFDERTRGPVKSRRWRKPVLSLPFAMVWALDPGSKYCALVKTLYNATFQCIQTVITFSIGKSNEAQCL
ncbi:hypothetical protein L6164_008701 [Bauhinia variegata]|uniref:Uncharacterized protein n=1 Tax=Bauhinia variegata TaxID=167791 RepID=A0ACB9PHH8_BAUVA|nr:hypothetical protein L6164_008701 [Bauhinia variegata]